MRLLSTVLTLLTLWWGFSGSVHAGHHDTIILDSVAHAFDTHISDHSQDLSVSSCSCQESQCDTDDAVLVNSLRSNTEVLLMGDISSASIAAHLIATSSLHATAHPSTAPPARPSSEYSAHIGISARLLL